MLVKRFRLYLPAPFYFGSVIGGVIGTLSGILGSSSLGGLTLGNIGISMCSAFVSSSFFSFLIIFILEYDCFWVERWEEPKPPKPPLYRRVINFYRNVCIVFTSVGKVITSDLKGEQVKKVQIPSRAEDALSERDAYIRARGWTSPLTAEQLSVLKYHYNG